MSTPVLSLAVLRRLCFVSFMWVWVAGNGPSNVVYAEYCHECHPNWGYCMDQAYANAGACNAACDTYYPDEPDHSACQSGCSQGLQAAAAACDQAYWQCVYTCTTSGACAYESPYYCYSETDCYWLTGQCNGGTNPVCNQNRCCCPYPN
jgi:hypothetical protein